VKLDFLEPAIRLVREFFQDQWFDRTRNVRTSGNVSLQAGGLQSEELRDSEFCQPARPQHIRQAIRNLPVQDLSSFNFIDLGAGKGRTLFVAAEFPFKAITGVELSPVLHEQACRNIRRFHGWKRGSRNIRAIHANAKEFKFPDGNLVLNSPFP
jgi:tRNA G46 methylase TrmB